METWQAINGVRVVRKFSDEPIADEHLERILNAGRRTGSSKNDQHWAFVVIRDRTHLRSWRRSAITRTISQAPLWRSRSSRRTHRATTTTR